MEEIEVSGLILFAAPEASCCGCINHEVIIFPTCQESHKNKLIKKQGGYAKKISMLFQAISFHHLRIFKAQFLNGSD